MKHSIRLMVAMAVLTSTTTALAAVSGEEAKQLGTTLTPVGAIKAGNKEGTIPEWNNEGVKSPPDYNPTQPGHWPEPWKEKPLYTITAQNMAQYQDKITEGEIAMLKKYPTFRMDIYPTHRTMKYPQWVLDNSIKNATACKLSEVGLDGCYGGVPFPIPKTGLEVIWNHLAGYRSSVSWGNHANFLVDSAGGLSMAGKQTSHASSLYYDPSFKGTHPVDTYIWRYRQIASEPPRIAGEQILFIDNLRAVGNRRAWQYIPGQRRVKLAPDIGFDTPMSEGGSAATFDDVQTFFGSPERYNWKLIGKTEKYIMYNNYRVTDPKVCPPEVAFKTKNFMNPDCTRWELHRVWQIEATLKPIFRHIYPRRMMYFDEDNGIAGGTSVNYDASGNVYRISHGVAYTFYAGGGDTIGADNFVVFDLANGSYVYAGYPGVPGNDTGWGPGHGPAGKVDDFYFTPEAMAGQGIR